MKTLSPKRKALLSRLETIIGNQCYNGNIQNYGPGGTWEGEGREFRYPITHVCPDYGKNKDQERLHPELPEQEFATAYYAFGANQLHIIRGLDKALNYLEEHHGLKIE